MQPVRLDQIIKELAVVRRELEGHRVQGPARLELLRRQASLGDRRDSALDAARLELLRRQASLGDRRDSALDAQRRRPAAPR